MTYRIAHLSDLHFGTVAAGAEAALAADLRAQQPDVVVVTGDVTQRARPDEFTAARRFLEALPAPVLAVPGNHDIPLEAIAERMIDPFGRWRRYLGRAVEDRIILDRLLVVGINSVRRTAAHFDWSAGRVSHQQIARLSALCRAHPGSRVVVALHHPSVHPLWAAGRQALGRGHALRAALAALGVEAVLSGHLHRPYVAHPCGAGPVDVVAGSSLSWRDGGHGNSYNLIELRPRGIEVMVRECRGGIWRGTADEERIDSLPRALA